VSEWNPALEATEGDLRERCREVKGARRRVRPLQKERGMFFLGRTENLARDEGCCRLPESLYLDAHQIIRSVGRREVSSKK